MTPATPDLTAPEAAHLGHPPAPTLEGEAPRGDALALALPLAAAVAITVLLRRIARTRALRRLGRAVALLEVGVWWAAIVLVLRTGIGDLRGGALVIAALALGLVGLAATPLLRDVLAGLALAIEGRWGVGDDVRVGDAEGRITALGVRSLELRGADGTTISIPYGLVQARAVARLALADLDGPVELTTHVPEDMTMEAAVTAAELAASLSPLASPRRRPEVFVSYAADGALGLRIRGYVFDRAHTERYRSDVGARLYAAFVGEGRPPSPARRGPPAAASQPPAPARGGAPEVGLGP